MSAISFSLINTPKIIFFITADYFSNTPLPPLLFFTSLQSLRPRETESNCMKMKKFCLRVTQACYIPHVALMLHGCKGAFYYKFPADF